MSEYKSAICQYCLADSNYTALGTDIDSASEQPKRGVQRSESKSVPLKCRLGFHHKHYFDKDIICGDHGEPWCYYSERCINCGKEKLNISCSLDRWFLLVEMTMWHNLNKHFVVSDLVSYGSKPPRTFTNPPPNLTQKGANHEQRRI